MFLYMRIFEFYFFSGYIREVSCLTLCIRGTVQDSLRSSRSLHIAVSNLRDDEGYYFISIPGRCRRVGESVSMYTL